MLDALARSIAVTAADVLGQRAMRIGSPVPDEAIGLYLWHERGFREHDTLVAVINHTRAILDDRTAARSIAGTPSTPVQLCLDLRAA